MNNLGESRFRNYRQGRRGGVAAGVPKTPDYWNEATAHLAGCDRVFERLAATYEGECLRSRGQLFQSLANAIVGQQISVAAASSIWGRVKKAAGGRMTPGRVLALSTEELRACGLSGRKVEYLQGIAESFDGPYRGLRWARMEDAEIRERLIALRGIGPWTVDMVLIFTFLRPDVLPLLDIGLIRSMERHWNDGEPMAAADMEALAEPWRPYRSVATWLLWRDIDPEPVAY